MEREYTQNAVAVKSIGRNDDGISLQTVMERDVMPNRAKIYGLCAIWIVLFHISSRIEIPSWLFPLGRVVTVGNVGVDVFMFLSGYCMYHSWSREPKLGRFFRKRVARVLRPYLIIAVPYYVWKNLIETPTANGSFSLKGFLLDISSVSFWKNGLQTTWFVAAIIAFYLIVPAVSSIISEKRRNAVMLLGLCYAVNGLGLLWYGRYHMISIALVRLPIFVMGMITKRYGDQIIIRQPSHVKAATVAVAVVFIEILPVRAIYQQYFGTRYELLWFFYTLLIPGLMLGMVRLFKWQPSQFNRILEQIGSVSLELYMVHVIVLHIKDYYFGRQTGGYLLFICRLFLPFMG